MSSLHLIFSMAEIEEEGEVTDEGQEVEEEQGKLFIIYFNYSFN